MSGSSETHSYPIVVGRSAGDTVIAAVIAGLGLVVLAVAVAVAHGTNNADARVAYNMQFILLIPAAVLCAFAWRIFSLRVTLWSDHLEVWNGYWARQIDRSQIAGYRISRDRSGNDVATRLVTNEPAAHLPGFPSRIRTGPETAFWFSDFRNLDEEDLSTARLAMERDPRLGATDVDRNNRLRQIKNLTIAENVLGVCLGIGAWFIEDHYNWAVIANFVFVLLSCATFAVLRRYVSLLSDKTDPRPALLFAFAVPSFALAYRAMSDIHLEKPLVGLEYAAACAVIATFLLWKLDAAKANRALPMLAIVSFAYFGGAIVQFDVMLDESVPQTDSATITRMYETHGRSTYYHLALNIGIEGKSLNVDVPYSLYKQAFVGKILCVETGEGRFGLRWYEIVNC